jgi:hypothetical protein
MLQMVFATVSWSPPDVLRIIGYRDPWNWVPSRESQGGRHRPCSEIETAEPYFAVPLIFATKSVVND